MPVSSNNRLGFTSFSPLRSIFLLFAAIIVFYLLLFRRPYSTPSTGSISYFSIANKSSSSTTPSHLLFGIAASSRSWPSRRHYVRSWWRPGITRGFVFLDSLPHLSTDSDRNLPPLRESADTSRFPYSFKGGQRSAIRVARVAKELVDAVDGNFSYGEVRWIVLGDDDTVFFLDNLAETLAEYDWEQWYYVGSSSESVEQNTKHFFDMAFGGGGFAISYPLAKVLSKVMDSCLMRHGHLYGSDARVFACLAELGVGLTREPGFHQVDLRGNLLGFLSTHPLPPVVSLHHIDSVDPLFPGMNHSEALSHLMKPTNIDPRSTLQQTVCYDHKKFRTVSVSWGFAVQVFEGNKLLTDLLPSQKTFRPWKRGRNVTSNIYMFNTREFPSDSCKRPAIFLLESVDSSRNKIESSYSRSFFWDCMHSSNSNKDLQKIAVSSEKYYLEIGKAIRRRCCDVLASSSQVTMNIAIRKCRDDELITMYP